MVGIVPRLPRLGFGQRNKIAGKPPEEVLELVKEEGNDLSDKRDPLPPRRSFPLEKVGANPPTNATPCRPGDRFRSKRWEQILPQT